MRSFKPKDWHSVTPRMITADVPGLVEFLKAMFDARGEPCPGAPAEMTIGDSIVMVSDGENLREAMSAGAWFSDSDN